MKWDKNKKSMYGRGLERLLFIGGWKMIVSWYVLFKSTFNIFFQQFKLYVFLSLNWSNNFCVIFAVEINSWLCIKENERIQWNFQKIDYNVTTIINDVAPIDILIHFLCKFDVYFRDTIETKTNEITYVQFIKK